MQYATITGWGKCVPPATLTNDDLATFIETSDEWIKSRTGISQRHISHVNTSELASVAAKRALAAAGIDGSEIDMIILASASPDTLIPNIASTVQANIGSNCAAFDINAACSGFLYGLGLASSQIKSGQSKKVLVIGAERLSFYLDWSRRETAVLFGDGAGAVVVEASTIPGGVLGYELNNDPDGRDILKAGFGTAMDRFSAESLDFYIQFDGQEIFKRAINGMNKLSTQVLEKCGVDKDEVDLVIPHQANERIIDTLVSRMKIPKEKAFVNIANYGNTSAATIPIAICDALEKELIKPHQTILSCAFGAGLTSAALLLQWGERVKPLNISDAELPPCDQSGIELVKRAVDYFCN
ncbi:MULTISPECIES: ketoacyl-ACP synthase III [Shewanella]|jgi:3-oxoacyl-[acyl-carrier-protein] synthase-3|uniref:Beta-ketoacyl-[acyl-carrier-protein] synthase III n=3 Tax=Shewanella putrefaciens TaxID=24 RepID=E6XPS2_SHEP2|nr:MULTISPECIES: ketoacyl-ACP synthase III [Shewanella]CAD6364058.1 3-oxoacyl-[acyl-carrier-protein] synthase 3 protein 2 [Shewanella hafniensis]ABM24491.1 3-oxoacyl-[acyl-carrier-protein] synthase III [Shewanella sp. W3-18-1]MCA1897721.1 ketoacyl-ACP synthase III [Shewanella putrefaciens]MCK7634327.1 ketoacyl-ACP synthase III [Shewanella sp. JNE17]MCK7649454.1 ketoacyl-ACP synthase III [Shewanella sp. JNE8]